MVSIVGPDHGIVEKDPRVAALSRSASWFSVLTAIKVSSLFCTLSRTWWYVLFKCLVRGYILGTLAISNAPLLSSKALQ